MSQGKWSPTLSKIRDRGPLIYNARGELPPPIQPGEEFSNELHRSDCDSRGCDIYGYSAYDAEGCFVGIGEGVDRDGYTEMDYLNMSDEEWDAL